MKLSVHAIPHQSFLSIGSEVPIAKKSSFPPGEAKGVVRIRPGFHKNAGAYRTPQPLRRQLPFQGRLGAGLYEFASVRSKWYSAYRS